jgi:hypothetical protein
LGLSGSISISFRADKSVAAKRIAYFRSSVMRVPAIDLNAGRVGKKILLLLVPSVPELFHGRGTMSCVLVGRIMVSRLCQQMI